LREEDALYGREEEDDLGYVYYENVRRRGSRGNNLLLEMAYGY
jgi:hypothetical protein